MRKYLFYGSYTPEGYKGLLAEGGVARMCYARRLALTSCVSAIIVRVGAGEAICN